MSRIMAIKLYNFTVHLMGARGEARSMKYNEVEMQTLRRLSCMYLIVSLISICAHTACGGSLSAFTYAKFDSISDSDFLFQSPGNKSNPTWAAEYILLTPDPTATVTQHQLHNVGRIVFNHPFQFRPPKDSKKDVFSFSTSFTFTILTTSSYGKCGDGLAFVITGDKQLPLNSTGGYLGLASQIPSTSSKSLAVPFFAVEFDTFQNLEHDIDDPSASHIGIDINSLKSRAVLDTSGNNSCCTKEVTNDTDTTQCPHCDDRDVNISGYEFTSNFVSHGFYPELFLYNNYTFTAWVEYNASTQLIQVWMTNRSTDQRPAVPCLSLQHNLSEIFWSEMFVGISAASGNNFQGNNLLSWNFTIHSEATKGTWHRRMLVSIAVAGATIAIIGGVAVCIFTAIRRRKRYANLAKRKLDRLPRMEMASVSMPRYSYNKLKRAAQSFNQKAKVGEGGFSSVYKGVLKDGTQVAVKRLKEGVRMEEEFATEVQIISQIRHRNLLQLQGWCYDKGEALLVYWFMPNGSLDSYLFGDKKASHCLDSETRIKVLMGVAAALEYLHGGLGGCVLHRDVKAANVLLSNTFEALLGDFGLARLITHDQVVTLTAAGTPGYVAPEVIYTGKATEKADVYSFGVLALEVACGRRALDASLDTRLIDWVWALHQSDTITDALDPNLNLKSPSTHLQEQKANAKEEEDYITQQEKSNKMFVELQWQCVLHLGLLCCHPCPDSRPTMRQVYQSLQETTLLPLPPFRPMYPTSNDLSSFHSNLSSTYSLDHSAPCVSDVPSGDSPLND